MVCEAGCSPQPIQMWLYKEELSLGFPAHSQSVTKHLPWSHMIQCRSICRFFWVWTHPHPLLLFLFRVKRSCNVHPAPYSVDSLGLGLLGAWDYHQPSSVNVKMELYFHVSLYTFMAWSWKNRDIYSYVSQLRWMVLCQEINSAECVTMWPHQTETPAFLQNR